MIALDRVNSRKLHKLIDEGKADKEWYAQPLNLTLLRDYHRIGLQSKARSFGGQGFTMVMNVSVGPIAYDANNDDEIDFSDPTRGLDHFVTYIIRVYWTTTGTLKGHSEGACGLMASRGRREALKTEESSQVPVAKRRSNSDHEQRSDAIHRSQMDVPNHFSLLLRQNADLL